MAARRARWLVLLLGALTPLLRADSEASSAAPADGPWIYCRHCGAPLLPCTHLEHVPSPRARGNQTVRACGHEHAAQAVPHPLGRLALTVRAPFEAEIEASGASFVSPSYLHAVTAELALVSPEHACAPFISRSALAGKLALARRGGCTFHQKAAHVQGAGAVGLVVMDSESGPIAGFTMSGPEAEVSGVHIGVGIISREDSAALLHNMRRARTPTYATLGGFARTVLTARAHKGLWHDPLPGTGAARQRAVSWFPSHNFRLSKCRVCNAQVGFFFNRTAAVDAGAAHACAAHAAPPPGSSGAAADGEGGAAAAAGARGQPTADGDAAGEPGEPAAAASCDPAHAAAAERSGGAPAPRVFHALFAEDVADARLLRGMLGRMHTAPVL